jgi:hypothetical protein
MIKSKSKIDHAKNAQLAYMILKGDLKYKEGERKNEEITYFGDPFGAP